MTAQELRDRVLALQRDRKPQPLDFEPWGDGIYIRVLTADDQAALAEGVEAKEMPKQVILHCLVDEDGERIFIDEDAQALGAFPFPEIMQVFGRVAKLNGLSTEELDEAMASFAPAPDEHRSDRLALALGLPAEVIGEQVTARELMRWQAYEQTYGSILVHERIDAGFAQVSLLLAQAFSSNGKRYRMRDFMPPWFQDLTEDEAMAQELAALRGMVQ